MRSAPPAPTWLVDTPLAHRGLHGDGALENTLEAFAAARDAGYGVELDVHLAADGVPVVVHDPVLTRLVGQPVRVARTTSGELAALPLLGGSGRVPTLGQALDVLGRVPVMVECKTTALRAGRLEAAVAAALDHHRGPWCVAGFNPGTARWFRRHRPRAVRVLTAGPLTDAPMPSPVRRRLAGLRDLAAAAPHAVSYELVGLPHPVTDAWRAGGGTLVTWTVRTDDEVTRARELADNLIFEGVRP